MEFFQPECILHYSNISNMPGNEDHINLFQRADKRGYNPNEIYSGNRELKEVTDPVQSGIFSRGDTNPVKPIIDSLPGQDLY
jgi:hypothetical protein